MHPIYDPSKLTDDELLSRLGQAHGYLHMQHQLGHDSAVDSIKETIRALDEERQSRFRRQTTEEQLKKTTGTPDASSTIILGELDTIAKPAFIDEDERARSSKIRRRRL